MKKTIGICLFAAFLFVGALFGFVKWNQRGNELAEKEPPAELAIESELIEETAQTEDASQPLTTESMTVQKPFCYILREEHGTVVVYDTDGTTILLETHIDVSHLNEATKEALREGIYIKDEQELYALLESYSS